MPKQSEPKRALAVSFNWNTGEILWEKFEGDGCADKARGWVHPKSFIQRDFPEKKGWIHFNWWNTAAGEERGARIADELCNHGTITERVPK